MEERVGYAGEPLGGYASKFLMECVIHNVLIVSDILVEELSIRYTQEAITAMFISFKKYTEIVQTNTKQRDEAKMLAKQRDIPEPDALHAVLARDVDAVFITRDRHFHQLKDIIRPFKPEELIPDV